MPKANGLGPGEQNETGFLGTILIREKFALLSIYQSRFEQYATCVHSTSLTSFHPLLERFVGGADCGSRNGLAVSLANPRHYLDKATVCAFPRFLSSFRRGE
jgi:hypothetical protein